MFVRLLADTGIRRGEACGLCWDCVNFTDNTVTIKRNLQYTPAKGVYMETPKNGKFRIVDVDPDIMSMLRDLRNNIPPQGILRNSGSVTASKTFTLTSCGTLPQVSPSHTARVLSACPNVWDTVIHRLHCECTPTQMKKVFAALDKSQGTHSNRNRHEKSRTGKLLSGWFFANAATFVAAF